MSDYSIEAAAAELGCKVRWLKDNKHRFEHQGYGIEVTFTAAQLDAIRAACVVPPAAATATPPKDLALVKDEVTGRIPISRLKPRQRKTSTRARSHVS